MCLQLVLSDQTLLALELTNPIKRIGNLDRITERRGLTKLKKRKRFQSQCSQVLRKRRLLEALRLKKSKTRSKTTISHPWRYQLQLTKLDVLRKMVQVKGVIKRTDLAKEESTVMTTKNLTTSRKLRLTSKKTLRLWLKRSELQSHETKVRLAENQTSQEVRTRNEQTL
jgi:hypothetical protein